MKTKHLKAGGAAVALLIASSPVLATLTGRQMLGPSRVALDAFTFNCPAGTGSARARVSDTAPIVNVPARMRVVLTKLTPAPTSAPQAEDVNPGPLGSPTVRVFGGPGSYRAMFFKTADGPDSYEGDITCLTRAGAPIPAFPDLPPAGPLAIPQQNE